MPRFLLSMFCALLGISLSASAGSPLLLTAEQATREINLLERALIELHPGALRYQSEPEFHAAFDRARTEVKDGATSLQMFRLATQLSASLRCGHTWTNPLNQGEPIKSDLDQLPALPFRVRQFHGRLVVTASASEAVPVKSELLSIDQRSVPDLVAELLPYLRADGASDGKRYSQLDSQDPAAALDRTLPILHPPIDGRYHVVLRAPNGRSTQVTVSAMRAAARDAVLADAAGTNEVDDSWQFRIEGDTGILTLPTFAFWRDPFDWQGFLQRTFEQLRESKAQRLVIDLRRNEGGDSSIGRALVGYLIAQPFALPAPRLESAYERAPYDLARYLDTWDFSFFDRTGKVKRGEGRNWVPIEQPSPEHIVPLQPRFEGTAIALIGPRMSSAGFLVARDLQSTHAAQLIGEPTGGNRRGLNGGELAWFTLPYSGVAVDIPLVASIYDEQPDAPVLPDVMARETVEAFLNGRDTAMEQALRRP